MVIRITDIINLIELGSSAQDLPFAQYLQDNFGQAPDLLTTKATKIGIIKAYYEHKMEADTVYDSLSFQADSKSRSEVITPRSVKAVQALLQNNTAWYGLIVSNTKDEDGIDIAKVFSATEMLEFADLVTSDVEGFFIQRKAHCNNVEGLTTVQDVIDYDFSEA